MGSAPGPGPAKLLPTESSTRWSSSVRQIAESLELVVVENGVDVVDDVGLSPEVAIVERLTAVKQVLGVVQHDRAAVGTRVGAAGISGSERPLRGPGQRLQDRGSRVEGHLEAGVHHSLVPLVVQLDGLQQRQELLRRWVEELHFWFRKKSVGSKTFSSAPKMFVFLSSFSSFRCSCAAEAEKN